MPVYFFDTSALVKRYVAEVGSRTVTDIISTPGAILVIADITRAECVSALSRRTREGDISGDQYRALKAAFAAHLVHDYLLAPLDPSHVSAACARVERHGLRAYDAVQLAVALSVRRLLGAPEESLTFVSLTRDCAPLHVPKGYRCSNRCREQAQER